MALHDSTRTPQPRSGSRPDYFHPHCSLISSYQPLSRPNVPHLSRPFAPSPRRCLPSRPLSTPSHISNSLPSSPTDHPILTDRLRGARASTPNPTHLSSPDPRFRPGSARGNRRPIAIRPRPGSIPRANSVPGKHLRRSTPSSSRHRPFLESRLQTSSAASAVTAPSGIVAEGQMTVESDREGSGREALSRALRAVSRNGSSPRSRSWSRSEAADDLEPNKSCPPSSPYSSAFPSPYSAADADPMGFPFNYLSCHARHPLPDPLVSGGYITFASLNVHAPPSPPESPTPSESHMAHDPLRKGWWMR